MQEKKLLRDALDEILQIDYGEYLFLTDYAHAVKAIAKAALASTTEETEMEKLVAWLRAEDKRCQHMRADKLWLLGRTDMIAYTLMEITTQFGEEEGDKRAEEAVWQLEKLLKEAEENEDNG